MDQVQLIKSASAQTINLICCVDEHSPYVSHNASVVPFPSRAPASQRLHLNATRGSRTTDPQPCSHTFVLCDTTIADSDVTDGPRFR